MLETNSPQPERLQMVNYISPKDAAKMLRVTYLTFWKLLKSPTGPPYTRIPGSKLLRIRYDEFIIWMNKNRKEN